MIKDIRELEEKCKQYKEYQRMSEEIYETMEALKEEIKGYARGKGEIITETYKVKLTEVKTSRFDQSKFNEEHPNIYKMYMKPSEYDRLSIN